jgi:hypothetical protein
MRSVNTGVLILSKGSEVRRLRFLSPRGFSVDEGFEPDDYIGLQILDVTGRQLEGIAVEVSRQETQVVLSAVRIESSRALRPTGGRARATPGCGPSPACQRFERRSS